MNLPFNKQCIEYYLAEVGEVTRYLHKGFELHGQTVYHHEKKQCYQPLVKYGVKEQGKLPYLTPREDKCADYLLDKKNNKYKQIADRMSCSISNVRYLVNNLKDKFKVETREILIERLDEIKSKLNLKQM